MNTGKNLLMIGGAGLAVGAAMPWATLTSIFGQISKNGLDGDGMITGAIGVLILLGALFSKPKPGKKYSVGSGILCVIAGWIIIMDIGNVGDISDNDVAIVQVGYGLYISAVAALFGLIGGFTTVPAQDESVETPSQVDREAGN